MAEAKLAVLASRSKKMIYRDGDTVLKVFDASYPKSDILNEALNQARAEDSGLKVPRVLGVERYEEKWAIRQDYIEGETLEAVMARNPQREDELLERFLDVQLDIFAHENPLLNVMKYKMIRQINSTAYDATTRYELLQRLNSLPFHTKICHGDFHPANIMVTEDNAYYILDWSHVTQGNASADAALTYLQFHLEGKVELAEKYLRLFCLKSDTARQYVQRWMPIVAAAQSAKKRSEEKAILNRWVNVVEYQ